MRDLSERYENQRIRKLNLTERNKFVVSSVFIDKEKYYYADLVIFKASSRFDAEWGKRNIPSKNFDDLSVTLNKTIMSKFKVDTLIYFFPDEANIRKDMCDCFYANVKKFEEVWGYKPKEIIFTALNCNLEAYDYMEELGVTFTFCINLPRYIYQNL